MSRHDAITLKQLRALAAINQRGSITAAAQLLNLTVPAVSTQLKLLETNIGAPLFVRANDASGALTPQGHEVLSAIGRIEATLEQCFQTVTAIQNGKAGRLSLGVISTGKYFAPKLVALAKKMLPDIQIDLMIGNRERMLEALGDHSIDLGIMGRPPRFPEVEAIALGPNPHILIAPPGHELVGANDISPEQLLAQTFILRETGSGTRILMERFLDRIGDGMDYDKMEFSTNETIKQAVIAGLGIALISAHTVMDALAANRVATIEMAGLPIIRRWFLVRPQTGRQTPASKIVRQFLVDEVQNYLPGFLPALDMEK
ncbi:RuBisCO operon transcriptional regulator CbbR [hydrothermal vent metagenome]|uniref:RuBisCO operon transcriptional regulator CbbR n=1 Tax=hydrothermal vent metagenome TaxID=652676 RepID=A0A3B0TVN6_9ZZZZ